eukprot:TRINITY_DN19661_c0_g1_i2.p1 TRINITY_DN19661_c0_g1~~TRINITY_DN19661_c0_g1_i2.p1  ORF type:complete len:401 (-),score=48.74 TRINITY_DN19661_c0_g1_i2:324-1526(-)
MFIVDLFFLEQLFDSSIAPCDVKSKRPGRSSKLENNLQERYLRTLEKNRKAQKRFRENQKTKAYNLQQQVQNLTSRLQKIEIEKSELEERSQMLERLLREHKNPPLSAQIEPLDQAADSEKVRQAEGSLYLQSLQRTVDSDMIRNLHLPEIQSYFLETWEMMIDKMVELLKEVDVPNPDPESLRYLGQTVDEYRECMIRMCIINPIGTTILGNQSKFDPRKHVRSQQELDQITREAVKKMELSQPQKGVISFLWKKFCILQKKCMEQRQHIATQLCSLGPRVDMQWAYCQDFINTHGLIFQVRENWRQDYKNHWDLMQFIAVDVLSPIQFARMISGMQPIDPDFFVMCKIVTEEVDALNGDIQNVENIQLVDKSQMNQEIENESSNQLLSEVVDLWNQEV